MTSTRTPSAHDANFPTAILIGAARSWRVARDTGVAIQPSLFTHLADHRCGMLAPVFDSLMRLYEAALGRRVTTGATHSLSDDEHLLVALLDGTDTRPVCMECTGGIASALDCAICSTRIMMAISIDGPTRIH